jgi:hypothetical protein
MCALFLVAGTLTQRFSQLLGITVCQTILRDDALKLIWVEVFLSCLKARNKRNFDVQQFRKFPLPNFSR